MPKKAAKRKPKSKKAVPAKGRARRKAGSGRKLAAGTIRLTTDSGDAFTASFKDQAARKKLQQYAMQWAYTVRNRDRWLLTSDAQARIHERATDTLNDIGIGDAAIEAISRARLVEVAAPYSDERDSWEMRIFPWEYLLSAAVRARGELWRSLVVRRIQRSGALPARKGIARALIVTSCPGALHDEYSFEEERALVETNLRSEDGTNMQCDVLVDPTARQLKAWIRDHSPDVVHLTGVDAHLGAVLLELPDDRDRRDGFYLADDDGAETLVDPEELGAIINAGKDHTPQFVFINTYNSASRMAAMAVAQGSAAALGFQDFIDDRLAESFLANFYRAWTLSGYSSWAALDWAWRRLRKQPRSLRGSGVVLWTERSFEGAYTPGLQLEARLRDERREPFALSEGERIQDVLDVQYKPPGCINYSMLHNNADIFESFRLTKKVHQLLEGVDVAVSLQVGADHFSYRKRVDVDQNPTFLERDIRVPLTWDYVRGLKESVRSALYVEVSHGDEILRRDTHSVTLQPVQEWEDTDENRAWLPSFVLPRDAQVVATVRQAERYLRALADYGQAGFDGYQSLDRNSEAPSEGVDLQVRAIWCALVYEHNLAYINPPPSYAAGTQRLRTPSEVVASGHGTCIDLTLFLAACLEYVEIHPAIFLLQGHAFPAYWRSDSAYSDFGCMRYASEDIDTGDADSSGRFDTVHRYKDWMISGEDSHRAILASIQRGDLVPIESVAMTNCLGFAEAVEQGMENVEAVDEFESMIDLPLARQRYKVTPLPF